jgi:small subunit ribosomal protein S7
MVPKNYKLFNKSKKFNFYNLKKKYLIDFENINKKINKYNSKIILSEKFINCLMLKGKKSISEKIFFDFFKLLQKSSIKNIIFFFKFSLINSSLILSTYKIKNKKRIVREIPFMLLPKNRIIWSIKNIIKSIKILSKNCFLVNFKNEIINILKKNSQVLLKKNDVHTSSLKNKAFAHFRWF